MSEDTGGLENQDRFKARGSQSNLRFVLITITVGNLAIEMSVEVQYRAEIPIFGRWLIVDVVLDSTRK